MRRVLALVGVAMFVGPVLVACSSGSAQSADVGAQKAACKSAPDLSLGSPSQAPAPASTVGEAAVPASLGSPSQAPAPDDAPAPVAYRPAALPPEPVGELLPKARFIVTANVARVLYQGSRPPRPRAKKDLAGPIPPERCQVVRLDVTGVVGGEDPGSSLTVVKPLAPYLLETGQPTSGEVFLVEAGDPYPIILGRYGPYPIGEVQAALASGQ
jgi:hypothetical protein